MLLGQPWQTLAEVLHLSSSSGIVETSKLARRPLEGLHKGLSYALVN